MAGSLSEDNLLGKFVNLKTRSSTATKFSFEFCYVIVCIGRIVSSSKIEMK